MSVCRDDVALNKRAFAYRLLFLLNDLAFKRGAVLLGDGFGLTLSSMTDEAEYLQ